jgi:predicted anti-sigma-YlaC factor YlaD
MDFDDINPIAYVAGAIGALIGIIILKRMTGAEYDIGLLWKILTPIVCALGGFFIVHKMAS